MNILEVILFIVAVVGVIALGIWKSRDEELKSEHAASDYFLAGRGLSWWLVGFSLIAANISTEQFVGMSGAASNWLGMAIASYEWMAAVTLVIVAFLFLPKFLKAGLYTIPEFLEYRFDGVARLAMSIPMVVTLVFVTTSSVIFSGAKFVSEYYNDVPIINNLTAMCWLIAIFAAVYVFVGGLKACAWTDLIWGAGLILGGVVVAWLAFSYLGKAPADELIQTKVENSSATVADLEDAGAWERFILLNDGVDGEAEVRNGPNGSGGKLHMVRPKEDSDLPWTALIIGLWIPNLYYWGLNQYIVQRTLGSKSLAEGQRGIVFAAFLKLIIPFVVVIPGILAFNLFSQDLHRTAAEKNVNAIETMAEDGVFTASAGFVTLQPDLAKKALEHNMEIAAASLPNATLDSPQAMTEAINSLAAQVQTKAKDEAGFLSRLLGTYQKPQKDLKDYDYDAAFPVLVRNLVKDMWWLSWFVLAALCGAVISSLASMLNSASTLATIDFYQKFTREKDQIKLVRVGRAFVVLFVLLAALVAPALDNFESIFAYIQEFQGFISPGILAVFIFGFFSPRTPRYFGALGIGTNVVAYAAFKWLVGPWLVSMGWWYSDEIAFLDRMGLCIFIVFALGIILTIFAPLKEPVQMPESQKIPLETSPLAKMAGIGVIVATVVLYAIFW
jgi:SSS family solute:Na+ symporter